MRCYKYKKIDAFTSGGSAGNPAACIYLENGEALSAAEMLAVARQHKGFVSEMVYCEPSQSANVKLTYYSSECEVDFCGHGTIACMYDLIKNDPQLLSRKEIYAQTNKKGVITVYNEIEQNDTVFISAPQPQYIGTGLSLVQTADALGVTPDSLSGAYPVDLINAGLSTLIVPMADLALETHTFPDERRLKDFCAENNIDIVLIYTFDTANPAFIAHTRIFAPKFGYLEDPATGSGNSAFGCYMLKHGLWDGGNVSVEQGGIDRIFNTVRLNYVDGRVLFGGSATIRIEGRYFL